MHRMYHGRSAYTAVPARMHAALRHGQMPATGRLLQLHPRSHGLLDSGAERSAAAAAALRAAPRQHLLPCTHRIAPRIASMVHGSHTPLHGANPAQHPTHQDGYVIAAQVQRCSDATQACCSPQLPHAHAAIRCTLSRTKRRARNLRTPAAAA